MINYNNFKVIHQITDYTCGPACALMIIQYMIGFVDDTEENIAKIMGTDNTNGTSVNGIERYFKNKGWIVNSSNIEGSPREYEDFKLFLDYNLSNNTPIMVENKAYDGHWRVIIGFDDTNDTLIVADPYAKVNGGINIISARDFFITWYDPIVTKSIKSWVTAKPPK